MERFSNPIRIAQGVVGAMLCGIVLGAWQQVLDMLAGRTVYAALAFWVAVVLGTATGFLLVRVVRRTVGGWGAGCAALAFLALGVWLIVQLSIDGMLQKGWHHFLLNANRSFTTYLWMMAKTAGLTVLVPAALALAALLGGTSASRDGRPGRVDWLVGGVLVLGGYLLVGWLCVSRSPEALTRMAALGMGVLACAGVLRKCGRLSVAWVFSAVVPVVVTGGLAVTLLPERWSDPLSADGVFGRLARRDSCFARGVPDVINAAGGGHAVVRYVDADYQFVGALDGRALVFGSKFVASRTLTGYVPMLVGPHEAKKVALVGMECGAYLPFFLRGGAEEMTVEAPKEIVAPLVAMDAVGVELANVRYGAVQAKADYDIIFVAPDSIWVRGNAMPGKAVLRRYHDALEEKGVVVVKVDGRALSQERFASIAKDFLAVFDGVQLWNVSAADWLFVGAKQKIRVNMDSMTDLLDDDNVFGDWVRAGNMGLPEMLACMVCDGDGLREWLKERGAEGSVAAAWRAPQRVILGVNLLAPALESVRQSKAAWVSQGEMDEEIYTGVMRRVEEACDARGLAVRSLMEGAEGRSAESLAAAKLAASVTPRDALLLQMVDHLELEARRRARPPLADFKGGAVCYEHLIALSGGAARYHHGLGFCLQQTRDTENAFRHFARAAAAAPEQTVYRLDLAKAAVAVGEFDEADRQYREVLKRDLENAEVLLLFAQALTASTRKEKDFEQAVKLAERACTLTEWKNTALAYGLADIYIEAGRVLEGVGLKRRLREQGEK